MQVNRISNNISIQKSPEQNNQKNKNTSFKGLDSACLGVANAIEYGGLAVSFTLQDMLGTNFPRLVFGLTRNKEENNGQANWNFAAKEGVREFLTGPSMFLIPMGMFAAAKKFFGTAADIPVNFIKSFGDIHSKHAFKDGKPINQQEFFKNVFSEMIENASGTENSKKAEEYAKKLSAALNNKKENSVKTVIEDLSEDFINITKSGAKDTAHTDFTQVKLNSGLAASFKTAVSHMIAYADDIVKKSETKTPNDLKSYIERLKNVKIVQRFSLNVLVYSAVMGFLQIIPKLYNKAEGKQNAGLKGLMKEETFNDKELNAKENKKVKEHSNPSFGSWASAAGRITGNGTIGKFAQKMEFDGCSVGFDPLVGIMAGGIMYPRLKNAKDKYDKEEILRRDLITCIVMCAAEKELRKGFSKINELHSGLVLTSKDKGFEKQSLAKKIFDYLRPINGVKILSSDQIRAKYTNIDKYKDGIKGFCNFISGQGGDLYKLFSLEDKSKAILDKLLKNEKIDKSSINNEIVTKVLTDKKNKDDVKTITEMFHPTRKTKIIKQSFWDKIMKRTEIIEDNPWVKKARTLNARFTALSVILIVPVFLGFMLPAINERSTKRKISAEQAVKNTSKSNNNNKIRQYNYAHKSSSVFAEMEKITK